MKITKLNDEKRFDFSDDDIKSLLTEFDGTDADDSFAVNNEDTQPAVDFSGLDDSTFSLIPEADITDGGTDLPAANSDRDIGISTMLSSLIKDEWEAIDGYNSAISTLRNENPAGAVAYIAVLTDILNEENKHVGQLQQLLKELSPVTGSISIGEMEAKEQIENSVKPGFTPLAVTAMPTNSSAQVNEELIDDTCHLSDVDDSF